MLTYLWWRLRQLWAWQQRRIDLDVLWPSCKKIATEKGSDLDHAKAAFAYHAFNDPAWLILGNDEIARRIDALKP